MVRAPGAEGDGAPDILEPLLAGAARGEDSALAALYDATSGRVFGWALRILRDRSAAEEATLDVFAQVWRKAKDFDPARGSAMSWLLTIARTRAIDILRTRERHAGERSLDAVEGCADPSPDPEARTRQAEEARTVRKALQTLSAEQREVIEAAFFGGLSHSEAAERLGLPLGTVKTRIRLGLIALRRSLAQTQEGWT